MCSAHTLLSNPTTLPQSAAEALAALEEAVAGVREALLARLQGVLQGAVAP